MTKIYSYSKAFLMAIGFLFMATVSLAEPPNIGLALKAVQTYHDSGEYDQDLTKTLEAARQFINKRAEENKKSTHPKQLAIVLDIDETSVSNYEKMAARQFVATKKQLRDEIKAANSPAIKPMLALYQDALKHDIKVFFVTGRKESERAPTLKNLKFAGYRNWAGLYLKPDDYDKTSIIPFKSKARRLIASKGYTVIASIGDQCSDIKGGFAERVFKLPNPFYYLP